MRAAALAGLPTAEVFYEPRTEACVVRRFDRQLRPDGTLARLVQYDLCQLEGTLSDRKYEKQGGQGAMLTPFHDLMCTRLYPGLSPEFAFDIGGELRPGQMGAEHLALLARQLEMQPRFLAQQGREMAERVLTAIEQATREIAPSLTPSARSLVERVERFVSSNTKKLAPRLTA